MALDRFLGGGAAVTAIVLACAGCAPSGTTTRTAPPIAEPAYPAVRGRTLSSSSSGVEWTRVLRVADAETAYRAARRLLVDGGFVLTKDREGTGGGDGQACTTALCVGFTATDIPGAGPTLAYDVFHPTGVVD